MQDLNPLTKETTEAALLFGRGMRAGVDRREQKKAAATHEREILRKMRESMARARPPPPCNLPCMLTAYALATALLHIPSACAATMCTP